MLAIKAEIRRFHDDSFPGWVECAFTDVAGKEHLVVEKVPVLTTEALNAGSAYPRPCKIACTLVGDRTGEDARQILLVDTAAPWAVESTEGQTRFEMFPEQIVEIEVVSSCSKTRIFSKEMLWDQHVQPVGIGEW